MVGVEIQVDVSLGSHGVEITLHIPEPERDMYQIQIDIIDLQKLQRASQVLGNGLGAVTTWGQFGD